MRPERRTAGEIEMPDTGLHHNDGRHLRSLTRRADQRLLMTHASVASCARPNRIDQHHIAKQIELFEPTPPLADYGDPMTTRPRNPDRPTPDCPNRHTHLQPVATGRTRHREHRILNLFDPKPTSN